MPHFGLMDEKKLGPVAGPFQRSRLHLRSARRRFQQGKISAGIATLYDALSAGMEAYAGQPDQKKMLDIRGEDLRIERDLYPVLVRSGVVGNVIDFDAFERLMEQALHREMPEYDYRKLLEDVEIILTQLCVLPFDESLLPHEDPNTF